MARYRFLVASCKNVAPAPWTDGQTYFGYAINDIIPLSQVQYENILNTKGTFSGKLPNKLNDDGSVPEFPQSPRDLLFIERNGQIVWAGFPWLETGSGPAVEIPLTGESIWSWYTDHHEYRRTEKWSQLSMEQSELVYRLAHEAAADCPGGPLVIWQWRDTGITYRLSDTDRAQPQKLGGLVDQVAGTVTGFDHAIVPHVVGDVVLLWWEMYYPKINFDTGLVLAYGGAINKYSYQANGGRVANDWREAGQAPAGGVQQNVTTPFADAWDEGSIDSVLHMQGSGQTQTSDQSLLQGRADQAIRDRKSPFVVTDITLNHDRDDTEFSRFSPGFFIHTVIRDGRIQVDQPFQIASIKVELADTDDAMEKEETITLTAVSVA